MVDDPLIQASFEELTHILRWVDDRVGPDVSGPNIVLIGGWAVYAYNPYFGSLDIDLVTSSRIRGSLMQHLRDERGYRKVADDQLAFRGVLLHIPAVGDIKIDFATFEFKDLFEGVDRSLHYLVFKERARWETVGDVRLALPDRGVLLLSKLKAAWDRRRRLEDGRSTDPSWEEGKLVKDLADILALIDPERGGDEIDLVFIRRSLLDLGFLVDILEMAGSDEAGAERYGVDLERAGEIVGQLMELTL
ncbi:MAG: hypothetical protein GQ558_07770 [Thermoplasmata archaeon]|nr:hypothetical protein [Thermoplasmata archaeon]